MKKIKLIVTGVLVCTTLLVGCGEKESEINTIVNKETNIDINSEKKDINILNPFNLEEKTLSDEVVLLDNYNCKVQMHGLETCRLMLSSFTGKSENNFSFVGYAYEVDTNIPNAIFIDNTSDITNSDIYAVGLVGAKEGEEQLVANPIIASYKYSKTSDTSAIIINNKNQTIGEVKSESATEINKRIEELKIKLSV